MTEAKKARRERKHKLINERITYLRGKYTGMTSGQRASEARMFADRTLAAEKRDEVGS